jgi:hypothetical protein
VSPSGYSPCPPAGCVRRPATAEPARQSAPIATSAVRHPKRWINGSATYFCEMAPPAQAQIRYTDRQAAVPAKPLAQDDLVRQGSGEQVAHHERAPPV